MVYFPFSKVWRRLIRWWLCPAELTDACWRCSRLHLDNVIPGCKMSSPQVKLQVSHSCEALLTFSGTMRKEGWQRRLLWRYRRWPRVFKCRSKETHRINLEVLMKKVRWLVSHFSAKNTWLFALLQCSSDKKDVSIEEMALLVVATNDVSREHDDT